MNESVCAASQAEFDTAKQDKYKVRAVKCRRRAVAAGARGQRGRERRPLVCSVAC